MKLHVHNGVDRETVVGIEQIQIEQVALTNKDSAKSFQTGSATLIDLNRAGTGILEIVTRPDLQYFDLI